ncbi:MAG: ribosome biogenesis GTPase Der [Acetobacter sp.]|nr:ribosome biogenesis GTPase Der [Acetobacter sp.]
MALKLAIVGRPNVGKSTLFNRLAGKKLALVHDLPGVTRDRKEVVTKLKDLELTIIDTAGYEEATEGKMEERMWQQTHRAIEEADVVLFLFDARAGMQAYDEHFADLVRKSEKPVLLLANKCEGRAQEQGIYEAYKLGLGEPIIFSAEHSIGFDELYLQLKDLEEKLSTMSSIEEIQENDAIEDINTLKKKPIQIAIVGRPNVGKSTLVNALLNDERMLTGPEAGLTRDAITSRWEWKGWKINLVDTAGLRKQARVTGAIEKMSVESTFYAANMAQVVILVLDADGVLDKQDLTIARKVLDEGRALVVAVNKWDIADKQEALQKLNDKLATSLTQAEGVPTVTISALKKRGLDKLLSAVIKVYERWNTRIATAPLNQWFRDVQEANPAPLGKNKRRIKLKYITQAKTRPPSFYIFSSNPEGLPDSYLRYLTNQLRETFNLRGIPIRITVRKADNPYAE